MEYRKVVHPGSHFSEVMQKGELKRGIGQIAKI